MSTALINALAERHGLAVVNEAMVDSFLDAHEHTLLFFPGDAERLVESSDAAVILGELMKVFGDRIAPALVDKASERLLQRRYRFTAFPAMVFLRGRGYLGCITRLLDWQDYLGEIEALLGRDVSEPPPFRMPATQHPQGLPNGSRFDASSGDMP
ncbi:MAG: hydrogenase-1 expression HyaE [Hyphomicrobiaceae bacterium]|nr:MAG: hydrogenase-1 expression HyaE [Hyphomicrobiaceae bacterium]